MPRVVENGVAGLRKSSVCDIEASAELRPIGDVDLDAEPAPQKRVLLRTPSNPLGTAPTPIADGKAPPHKRPRTTSSKKGGTSEVVSDITLAFETLADDANQCLLSVKTTASKRTHLAIALKNDEASNAIEISDESFVDGTSVTWKQARDLIETCNDLLKDTIKPLVLRNQKTSIIKDWTVDNVDEKTSKYRADLKFIRDSEHVFVAAFD
jgi:hypothetical protein